MLKKMALLFAALTIATALASTKPVKDIPLPPCYPCSPIVSFNL